MWLPGRKYMLGLIALVLMTACAAPSASEPDISAIPSPTSEAESKIHCIRFDSDSGARYCYVGEELAGDTALLEKTASQYCKEVRMPVAAGWCSLNIWKDEAQVGQKYPLTDEEESTRIARFAKNWGSGIECFEAYSDGEVLYRSKDCTP